MTPEDTNQAALQEPAGSGIAGLDKVLRGGFTRNRFYLVEGLPGSGKTTLALQFLLAGRDAGERCLYVTLAETEAELRAVATSHGWSLEGLELLEVLPPQEMLAADAHYTLFHPAEVELGRTAHVILDEVERLRPQRVVFDSLSELRLLAGDTLQYRRQVLGLKQFFAGRGARSSCSTMCRPTCRFRSIVHGVLSLEAKAEDSAASAGACGW